MRNHIAGRTVDSITPVCTPDDIIDLRKKTDEVTITDKVIAYAREITDQTRKEPRFVLGASPRALLSLIRASQAKAFLSSRDFVKPDDIKAVAVNVLHHRLKLTPEAKIAGENADSVIRGLVLKVKVPME